MPVSPELTELLSIRRDIRREEEDNSFISKLPLLAGISDYATISTLHEPKNWPDLDNKMRENGITSTDRYLVRQTLVKIGQITLPRGLFHHVLVGEIRDLTDEELDLFLDSNHGEMAIVRALFGKREIPPEEIQPTIVVEMPTDGKMSVPIPSTAPEILAPETPIQGEIQDIPVEIPQSVATPSEAANQ